MSQNRETFLDDVLVIYCCVKFIPKCSALKWYLLCHSSYGSSQGASFLDAYGSGFLTGGVWAAVISRLHWGEDLLPGSLHGCWEALVTIGCCPVLCHVNLFMKQLQHDSGLPSEQASKTVREGKKTEAMDFLKYNLWSVSYQMKVTRCSPHSKEKDYMDMKESEGAILEVVYHR